MADLLAFLTKRGKYLPIDLRPVATVVTTKGMFFSEDSPIERLIFPNNDWSPKTFQGVPFLLVDPQGDRVPNAIMLYGPSGQTPPKMPKIRHLPGQRPRQGDPLPERDQRLGGDRTPTTSQTTSMIVRLHYADGKVELEESRTISG